MDIGHSATDYLNALIALVPTGACWPVDPDSNWIHLLGGVSQEYGRIDGRTVDLFNEAFPDTSTELIENWERVVGLPDAFSDPAATLDERRAAILFKLQARGGQSVEYIEALVGALGYTSNIIESRPFEADISLSDDFIFDDTWVHIFIVIVQNPVSNHTLFEGRIRSIQPAQSKSIFFYVDDINDF